MYVCMYVYIYIYMYVHIHIYIYIYIHMSTNPGRRNDGLPSRGALACEEGAGTRRAHGFNSSRMLL